MHAESHTLLYSMHVVVIKQAATAGQEKILELLDKCLISLGSKLQWLSIAQFCNAAASGDDKAIHLLLDQGINPNLKDMRNVSPLWRAAASGHVKVVKILLDTNLVDIDSRSEYGRPPMFWPAEDLILPLLTKMVRLPFH